MGPFDGMLDGMGMQWACSHQETTAPDDQGYALCTRCGSAVIVRLTRHILEKGIQAVLNQGRRH